MIEFVDIPTEQTTALTDLLLGTVSLLACCYLIGFRGQATQRSLIWSGVYGCSGTAALFGCLAHGMVLTGNVSLVIWTTIYFFLSLTVALFMLGALQDYSSEALARRQSPVILAVAMAFFAYSLVDPDNFMPFVVFELCAMLLSLCAYAWLSFKQQLAGATAIAVSIALTLVAAVIQATKAMSFTLFWPFDHNSVYHLIQVVAILILAWGLRAGMIAPASLIPASRA